MQARPVALSGHGLNALPTIPRGVRLSGGRWQGWRQERTTQHHAVDSRRAAQRARAAAAPAIEAAAGSSSGGPTAAVTFKSCRRVQFGQVLKVVGGHPLLGDWDASKAPAMSWSEGDQWRISLELPAVPIEFKVVVASSDGSNADWESGPNRVLQVPAADAAAHAAFEMVCDWGNLDSVLASIDEGDRLPVRGADTPGVQAGGTKASTSSAAAKADQPASASSGSPPAAAKSTAAQAGKWTADKMTVKSRSPSPAAAPKPIYGAQPAVRAASGAGSPPKPAAPTRPGGGGAMGSSSASTMQSSSTGGGSGGAGAAALFAVIAAGLAAAAYAEPEAAAVVAASAKAYLNASITSLAPRIQSLLNSLPK